MRRGSRIWGVVRGILIAIGALILLYIVIAVVRVFLLGGKHTDGSNTPEGEPPAVIYYDEETGGTSIGTLAP